MDVHFFLLGFIPQLSKSWSVLTKFLLAVERYQWNDTFLQIHAISFSQDPDDNLADDND